MLRPMVPGPSVAVASPTAGGEREAEWGTDRGRKFVKKQYFCVILKEEKQNG